VDRGKREEREETRSRAHLLQAWRKERNYKTGRSGIYPHK